MDAVQCWCVRLDVAPPPETYYATLSDDERNRSARFRFEPDRRRFVVAHGVLRDLLGRYLGTDPGQIRFVYNAFGKPELHPEFGSRLTFNLAHSGDLALIAIARDAWVGVDVECIDLTLPLTSFTVPITTDPAPASVRCGRWSLFTLHPAPGYVGALAVSQPTDETCDLRV